MKVFLILSLLQSISGPCGAPQATADEKVAMTAAKRCVSVQVHRLARSRERADIVAAAAVAKCDAEVSAYRNVIHKCGGLDVALATYDALRAKLREGAALQVVEARAGR